MLNWEVNLTSIRRCEYREFGKHRNPSPRLCQRNNVDRGKLRDECQLKIPNTKSAPTRRAAAHISKIGGYYDKFAWNQWYFPRHQLHTVGENFVCLVQQIHMGCGFIPI